MNPQGTTQTIQQPVAAKWRPRGNVAVEIKQIRTKSRLAVILLAAIVPGALDNSAAQPASGTTFTKISTGSIVTDLGASWGGAWADYDGDGWLDLYVTNGGSSKSTNFLYHNNGDGSFTRVTDSILVKDHADFHGSAWVDWNNDGNLDLAVATDGSGNFLYQNNGDGSFTKLSNNGLTPGPSMTASVISWGDFDLDGYLDCFVGGWNNAKSVLYRNLGTGSFLRLTTGAVGAQAGNTAGAAWVDYNHDGWPDLFVSNFQAGGNLVYRNQPPAGLIKMTSADVGSITTDADRAGGCAWGDFDNDGNPDVYITSLSNPPQPGWLYHNNGDGTFTRVTDPKTGSLLTVETRGAGCAWADYDNDGYFDLCVTVVGYANLLYHNNGDGTFAAVETDPPAEDNGNGINSWNLAWADYNNDGFLDLFVANGGAAVTAEQTNFLYRNNGNSNGWIKIRCEGTASNRAAIGAKVRVRALMGGRDLWQSREIAHGSGWSSSPLEVHFGLGDATNVSMIRIEWPSGTVQTLEDVRPKQSLLLKEPARLSTTANARVSVRSWPGQSFKIQTSTDLRGWRDGSSITNSGGSLEFTVTPGTDQALFYRARTL